MQNCRSKKRWRFESAFHSNHTCKSNALIWRRVFAQFRFFTNNAREISFRGFFSFFSKKKVFLFSQKKSFSFFLKKKDFIFSQKKRFSFFSEKKSFLFSQKKRFSIGSTSCFLVVMKEWWPNVRFPRRSGSRERWGAGGVKRNRRWRSRRQCECARWRCCRGCGVGSVGGCADCRRRYCWPAAWGHGVVVWTRWRRWSFPRCCPVSRRDPPEKN